MSEHDKERTGCTRCLGKIQASSIEVDDLGKAKSFRLFSIQRPHMRSFHVSWFCFFIAFTSWFGIQPLIPTIRKELGLSKKDVANSGIASIAATILVRIVVGTLCDRFGPRRIMAGLLMVGAIPLAFTGLVTNNIGLIVVRLCVGILGGCFIPCQFWTSAMFNVKIVGTANAMVGGWGNLGGGFTFLIMPALFEMVKAFGANEFLAWKLALLIPSAFSIIIGLSILFTTDDCPQGQWSLRKIPPRDMFAEKIETYGKGSMTIGDIAEGVKRRMSFDNNTFEIVESGVSYNSDWTKKYEVSKGDIEANDGACKGLDVWMIFTIVVLVIQYGLCFGVEIAVNTVMNLYFLYRFKIEGCVEGEASNAMLTNMTNSTLLNTTMATVSDDPNECSILTQNMASLIAAMFGLMNLFARALGGIFSDVLRKYLQIPGRLLAHIICLTGEGILLIIFSQMTTVPTAIAAMIAFSLFVQMSEGSTFAIVPYIHPRRVGVVAGFIGAGGNAGALIWNTIWSQLVDTDPSRWFWLLGVFVLCGNVLTLFIPVQKRRIWTSCFSEKSSTRVIMTNYVEKTDSRDTRSAK